MKMWEDLLKKQDMLQGYEIIVFFKTAEVSQIVQEIFEHNQEVYPFEMSILLSDSKILEEIFENVEQAIQWLNGMDGQKLAIRMELLDGTLLLVEQEELSHERSILLNDTVDILDAVIKEVHQITKDVTAVYTAEGMILEKKEELGFLWEIDEIPSHFNQAESIKVKIFFSECKEVLTLKFSYKSDSNL